MRTQAHCQGQVQPCKRSSPSCPPLHPGLGWEDNDIYCQNVVRRERQAFREENGISEDK